MRGKQEAFLNGPFGESRERFGGSHMSLRSLLSLTPVTLVAFDLSRKSLQTGDRTLLLSPPSLSDQALNLLL